MAVHEGQAALIIETEGWSPGKRVEIVRASAPRANPNQSTFAPSFPNLITGACHVWWKPLQQ